MHMQVSIFCVAGESNGGWGPIANIHLQIEDQWIALTRSSVRLLNKTRYDM